MDTTFSPVNVNNSVYAIAVQLDGKIAIGGVFTSVNDQPRWLVARIAADGALDDEFVPRLTKQELGLVHALAPGPDGTLFVAGDTGIYKLNKDGTLDPSFRVATDNHVRAIAVGEDGQILAGGDFKTIAGEARRGLARLKQDGSLDSTFGLAFTDPQGALCSVTDIQPAKPSGYYLAGNFTLAGVLSPVSLLKIGADGRRDTNFVAAVSGHILDLAVQANGKILAAGGHFGKRTCLSRLLPTGELDESFDAGIGASNTSEPSISRVLARADGKILAAGARLTEVRNTPCVGFAVLNPDGSPDTSFKMDGAAAFHSDAMAMQPDGNILLSSTSSSGGTFPRGLVRLIGLGR